MKTLFACVLLIITVALLMPLATPKHGEKEKLVVISGSGELSGTATSPKGYLVNVLFQPAIHTESIEINGTLTLSARGKSELLRLHGGTFQKADPIFMTNSFFLREPTWTNFQKGEIRGGEEIRWTLIVSEAPKYPITVWLKSIRYGFE